MVLTGAKKIRTELLVSEIVADDYRTADVFRKYSIDFFDSGDRTLEAVCKAKDIWEIDFLTDYITNIHHQYLRKALPEARDYLFTFMESSGDEFPFLQDVFKIFNEMAKEMFPHLQQEETIIFPYIRQISHAYHSKESYAGLLVRTLRKPVENVMNHEHESVNRFLRQMRKLTSYYSFPDSASLRHRVTFLKLLEIDNDLVQHLYLENEILFPGAIALEKELLERKD